jgi:hypothetical protein
MARVTRLRKILRLPHEIYLLGEKSVRIVFTRPDLKVKSRDFRRATLEGWGYSFSKQ